MGVWPDGRPGLGAHHCDGFAFARHYLSRRIIAGMGGFAREHWRAVEYLAGVLGTTLFLGAQPRRWGRMVRGVFTRQLFFFGVESVRFILIVSVLVGISVVVQLGVWT